MLTLPGSFFAVVSTYSYISRLKLSILLLVLVGYETSVNVSNIKLNAHHSVYT